MATIQIGAVIYPVYGNLASANAYFTAASHGAAWLAFASSFRNQLLVTAMRKFERTGWQGAPFEPIDKDTVPAPNTQPLQWPRTGLFDRNGVALITTAIPQDIIDGNFEYALQLGNTPSVQTDAFTGSNTKRTSVSNRVEGAVSTKTETEYFRPTIGSLPVFGQPVFDYIGRYLSSSEVAALTFVSGSDVVSPLAGTAGEFNYTTSGIP